MSAVVPPLVVMIGIDEEEAKDPEAMIRDRVVQRQRSIPVTLTKPASLGKKGELL